jgi:uncharacterized protein Usg
MDTAKESLVVAINWGWSKSNKLVNGFKDPLWLYAGTEVKAMTATKTIATNKASPHFIKQLAGYGLATARILYHLPDHPRLLQTYIWQDYDLAPDFPILIKFLAFWREKLDGPLHSVVVGHSKLIKPAEIKTLDGEFWLH